MTSNIEHAAIIMESAAELLKELDAQPDVYDNFGQQIDAMATALRQRAAILRKEEESKA